eukprot:1998152-Alexandrium_andersonii.AAC.1
MQEHCQGARLCDDHLVQDAAAGFPQGRPGRKTLRCRKLQDAAVEGARHCWKAGGSSGAGRRWLLCSQRGFWSEWRG